MIQYVSRDYHAYPNEKPCPGECDDDAEGVQDWQGLDDKTSNEDVYDTPAKLPSCPKSSRMLPSRLRTKARTRL